MSVSERACDRGRGHTRSPASSASSSPRTRSTSCTIPVDVAVLTHTEDSDDVEHEMEVWKVAEKVRRESVTTDDGARLPGTSNSINSSNNIDCERGEPMLLRSGSRGDQQSSTTGGADSDLPTDLSCDRTKSHSATSSPLRLESVLRSASKRAADRDKDVVVMPVSTLTTPSPKKESPSTEERRQRSDGAAGSTPREHDKRRGKSVADRSVDAITGTPPLRSPWKQHSFVSPLKHRRLSEGAPELPATLKGLYLAALSHQTDCPRATPLLYLLQLASEDFSARRRLAAVRLGREVERARCEALYGGGMEWKTRTAQRREQLQRRREEEELASCTFAPKLSRTAKKMPPKGQDRFMEKCVEWEKEQADRLAARYAREEELTAVPTEPKINPTSRALVAARIRQSGDPRPALWEPRRREATGPSLQKDKKVPVTSAEERRRQRQLRHLLQSGDGSCGSGSSSSSADGDQRGGVDPDEYLARVERDLRRRTETAGMLREHYELRDGGAVYASITGQPLFQPNAMPTVLRDGKRIPYDALDKKDQQEFRKFLRENGQEDAFLRCLAATHGKGERVGSPPQRGQRPSLGCNLVAALNVAADLKERNMDRLRAQITAEETFKPHITPRSAKLAMEKTGSVKIYKRPFPAKYDSAVMKQQRAEEDRLAQEREARRNNPAAVRAEEALAAQLVARTELWQERREDRLRLLAAQQEARGMAECTFTPHRALVHQLADSLNATASGGEELALALQRHRRRSSVYTGNELQQMATAADVRLANEVELLRAQTAHMDPGFLESVLDGEHSGNGIAAGEKDDSSARRNRGAYSRSHARHLRSGAKSVDGGSRCDPAFRLDPPTHGTTRTPQYLLSHLTLLNAPRLRPEHQRQLRLESTGRQSRAHSHHPGASSAAASSRVSGTSPILVPRSVHPSLSRSPFRPGWGDVANMSGDRANGSSLARRERGAAIAVESEGGTVKVVEEEEEEKGDLDDLPDPWAALDAQVEHILRRYE